MSCLHDGGLPLASWLSATLGQGEPNALHVALATALGVGDLVWSLNVDELIEAATDEPVQVAAYDDEVPAPGAVLLKPHGTVSRGQYIFRSDQVIRRLPPAWADRLVADCCDSDVVVIGYAGLDIDLRLVLDDALAAASAITWFAAECDRPSLLNRLPALGRQRDTFHGGTDPRALSAAFLDWADTQGLSSRISPTLRAAVTASDNRPPATLAGNLGLARGLLLERIGHRAEARRTFREQITASGPKKSLTAARHLATIDLYKRAPWTRPLLGIGDGPYAVLLPPPLRRRFDRVHVTLLSSHLGEHEAALKRVGRARNPGDSAIRLSVAKSGRFTGDLAAAIDNADAVREVESQTSHVDMLAHALFELTFAYTWAGDLDAADRTLRGFYGGVDALANVRWIAWATWQRACLAVYDNRPNDARADLVKAYDLFRSDGLAAGAAAALTVQLTSLRLLDDEAEREQVKHELSSLRNAMGWTSYTDTSIDLEEAEWARTHDDLSCAKTLYRGVIEASANRPVQQSLALLGYAEIQRAEGRDNAATADRVRQNLRGRRIRYVEAHLTVADYLADRISAQDGVDRIKQVAPALVTRSHGPARTPDDYCFGHHPEVHPLFMP